MNGAVSRRALAARPRLELVDTVIWLILAALVFANLRLNSSFLELSNVYFTFGSALALVLAAMAAGLVMLIAEIDLTIGSVMTLTNVCIARWASEDLGLALLLGSAVGVCCGLVVGGLVSFLRLPSIIVTLAMSTVWGGVALYVMPKPGGTAPVELGEMIIGPIPLIACVVLGIAWSWLGRSRAGRRIYGLGSDELAAYLSGIPLHRTKLFVFGLAGLLLGWAGIALTAVTGGGDPLVGSPYTLQAITAAVLGGISFAGGRGTLWGAIAGALVLVLITSVVQLSGVSAFYQGIVNGGLLVASVALSRFTTGRWLPLPRIALAARGGSDGG
ncbi:MAG: ABC transporter permease [Solirubrobacterales bacterium]